MTIQRQYFPNDEDQTGAAKALLRLQDTYNLDTDTLSKGNLPGKLALWNKSIWYILNNMFCFLFNVSVCLSLVMQKYLPYEGSAPRLFVQASLL